jgi:hypothetical protein
LDQFSLKERRSRLAEELTAGEFLVEETRKQSLLRFSLLVLDPENFFSGMLVS